MVRESLLSEIILQFELRDQSGISTEELVTCYKRTTAFRCLKWLLKRGIIEKMNGPREPWRNGRPPTFYRLTPGIHFYKTCSVKEVDGEWRQVAKRKRLAPGFPGSGYTEYPRILSKEKQDQLNEQLRKGSLGDLYAFKRKPKG